MNLAIILSRIKYSITPLRKQSERFSIIEMSWWFLDPKESKEELTKKFIDYLEKHLPEGLPRRYGVSEPPKFQYQETGKQQFLSFSKEQKYHIPVWYVTRPVMHVNFSSPEIVGFIKHGNKELFRANHIAISFDESVLDQPGWQQQLQTLFNDLSVIIKPFYGEVRTLHNYLSGSGTSYSDEKTEQNPTQAWWWTGIPQKLGKAIVVGEPYTTCWSKMVEKGTAIKGLYIASTTDWKTNKTINDVIGNVPKEIAQRKIPKQKGWSMEYNEDLPPVFPF